MPFTEQELRILALADKAMDASDINDSTGRTRKRPGRKQRVVTKDNMTPNQRAVYDKLSDKGIRAIELMRTLKASQSNVRTALDTLMKFGFAERVGHGVYRRVAQ